MSDIPRPLANSEYFAPLSLSSVEPLVWGELHGLIVDEPSQTVGVVYTTREAAEAALADPERWGARNATLVRVAHVRYRGVAAGFSPRFEFADEEERAAHLAATRGETK